jgi:hypothetical protein
MKGDVVARERVADDLDNYLKQKVSGAARNEFEPARGATGVADVNAADRYCRNVFRAVVVASTVPFCASALMTNS